jgi:arginase family enzyme
MSRLRAKCPSCRTLTAVAVGGGYECHSCGREFEAGLVRVPRAWGNEGEQMAEAAYLDLPYPEAAVIAEDTLAEQTLALAAALPDRPLVLGGCCCAHIGAVEGLAARHGRIAVVWLDAHGDLNTYDSSPSGNPWGMPLRMLLDAGTVDVEDTILLGARSLDPPEKEFIATSGLATHEEGLDATLAGVEGVYVAFDVDVLEPESGVVMFLPERGGHTVAQALATLARLASCPVVGAGFTGLTAAPANAATLARFSAALGL